MPATNFRGFMLTINNPKIPLLAYLEQWLADGHIVFGCGQTERGASGTLHHQVYIVTKANDKNKNGFTVKWVKDNIHSTAHIEPRRGTHEEACNYCTKDDTRVDGDDAGPFTVGQWSETEGQKKGGAVNASKIMQVKQAIDEGARDEELYQNHFGEMLRYGKAFERYRVSMKEKHRSWMTKAFCLYGPPGTGKSMRAWKVAKNNFGDDVYPLQLEGGDTVWWDGYCGQKVIIIEEFYGQMKIGYLLKLLDRYPLLVQTKGGMTPFLGEMVIFTSNEHPNMWYGKGEKPGEPSKIPLNILNALKRRFEGKNGTIVEMKDLVEIEDDDIDGKTLWDEMCKVADAPTPTPSSGIQTPTDLIDLTADEDLPQSPTDLGVRDYADADYEIEHSQAVDDDEDFLERPSAVRARRGAWEGMPVGVSSTPPRLARTLTFTKPVPQAGTKKKDGPEPVQSQLAFKKPRTVATTVDKDDDVDDK